MSQQNTTSSVLLSVREAATRAGVSDALVRDWITSGDLAHYRLGRSGRRGKIGIATTDLDAFLASRRVEARQGESAHGPATAETETVKPTTRRRRNSSTTTEDTFAAYRAKVLERANRTRYF